MIDKLLIIGLNISLGGDGYKTNELIRSGETYIRI